MPPYTRRNAAPYVPSQSETDKVARNLNIKETLTVSNVSTQSLSVLGNVSGVLNTPNGVTVGNVLKVPTVTSDPTSTDLTVGPAHAGLITIDTSTTGKMYFSVTRADLQTTRNGGVDAAKAAVLASNLVKNDILTAIEATFTAGNVFDATKANDYGVREVYNAFDVANPTGGNFADAAAVNAILNSVPEYSPHEFSKAQWVAVTSA
tara:strand:+ start:65 stop:682 length:618 start_codon:yes stop_codon:yes gene_type:complete